MAYREERLSKIEEAKAALAAESQAQAGSVRAGIMGVPDDEAQLKFTSPESRIIHGPGGRYFQQAYK